MASLGTRAISRMPASGGSGVSNAKKLADLYVSSNTGPDGEISDPSVYDNVIKEILAPFAGTIDGQNAIADYSNKRKALASKQSDVEQTVSALKQKEYGAWYVDDDGEDNTSFRNPAWVAQMTSESLDMILAETLATIDEKRAAKKSTAELESYATELIKRSDRMRTIAASLDGGEEVNLDGYGYYIDADPNTGQIRGASFMPTDAGFGDLSKGTIRTDSKVKVGNKNVPIYLPFVKQEDGTNKAVFGGKEYTGDSNLLSGGEEITPLTDRNLYKGVDSKFEVGKAYRSFNGKNNIDGSPKSDYIYVGKDNKMYKFSDDDASGKALLDSLRSVGAIGESIPRISPVDAMSYATNPLPSDASFIQGEQRGARVRTYNAEAAVSQAEADRFNNLNPVEEVIEGASTIGQNVLSGIQGFFGRKNRQSTPEQPRQSVGGVTSAPDVIESSKSFFGKRVQ